MARNIIASPRNASKNAAMVAACAKAVMPEANAVIPDLIRDLGQVFRRGLSLGRVNAGYRLKYCPRSRIKSGMTGFFWRYVSEWLSNCSEASRA